MALKAKPWMFTVGPDGKRQDEALHAELLDVDDYPLRVQSAQALVDLGMELDLVLRTYKLRPEDIREVTR